MPSFEKEQDAHALEHLAILRKGLLCGVCDDFLRDTYNLPCGHNFCQECIRDALADKSICPKCKIPAWPKDILKVAKADSAASEWVNHCEAKFQVLLARAAQEEGETDSVLSGNMSEDHLIEFGEESRVASPRGMSPRGSRCEAGRTQSSSKGSTSLVTATCLEKGFEKRSSTGAVLAAKTSRGLHTNTGGKGELSTPEHDKENLEASPRMGARVSDLPADAPRLGAECDSANPGKPRSNSISPHKPSGGCPSESCTVRNSLDKRVVEETADGEEAMDGVEQMGERPEQRNARGPPSRRGSDEDSLGLPLVHHSDADKRAVDSHSPASCHPRGSGLGSMAPGPSNGSLERLGEGMAHFVFSGKLPDTCDVRDSCSTPCSSVMKGGLIGTPPSVDVEKMENPAVRGERCGAARDTCEEKNGGEVDAGCGHHQGDRCGASLTKDECDASVSTAEVQVSPIPRKRRSSERLLSSQGSDEGNVTRGCPGDGAVIGPENKPKGEEGGSCPDGQSADGGTDSSRRVETGAVAGKSGVRRAGIDDGSSGERLDVHLEQGVDSQGSISFSPPLFADQAAPSPRSPSRTMVLDSCRETNDTEGSKEGCAGTVEKDGTNGESDEETLDQAEMMLGCSPADSTSKGRSPRRTIATGAPEYPGDSETSNVGRPDEMSVVNHLSPAHPPYGLDNLEAAGAFVKSVIPRQAAGGENVYDQLRTTATVGDREQPISGGEQERLIGGSSKEMEPSPSDTSGVAPFEPRAEGALCSADKDASELLMDRNIDRDVPPELSLSEYGEKVDGRGACGVLVDAGALVASVKDVRMPDDRQSANIVDSTESKVISSITCGNDRLPVADPAAPLPEDGGIASGRSPPHTDSDDTLRHEHGMSAARPSGGTRGSGCGLDPKQPGREESGRPRGALVPGLSLRGSSDERSKSAMEMCSSQSTVAEDIPKNDDVEDSRRAVDEHVMDSMVPESAACVGPEDDRGMGREEVGSSQGTVGDDTRGDRDLSAPCGRASGRPEHDSVVPETLPGAILLDEQDSSGRDQGLRIQDPGIDRSGSSASPPNRPGEGGNQFSASGHASVPSKHLECSGSRGLASSVAGHDGSQVECALHEEPQDQAQGTRNPSQQGSDAQGDAREEGELADSIPRALKHEEDERKSTLHSVPETATGIFTSQEIAETEEPSKSDPTDVGEGEVHETPGVQDRIPGGSLQYSVPETDQLRCRSPETESNPTCEVNHPSADHGDDLRGVGVLLNPASGGSPDGRRCPPDPADPCVERDRKPPKESGLDDEVSHSDRKESENAAADDLTTGSQGMEICTGTPIILRGGSGSTSSEDGADVPASRQTHDGFEERIADEAHPTSFGDDWAGGWDGESGNGENPCDDEGDGLEGNSSSKGLWSRSSRVSFGDGKEPADSMAHRFSSGNRSKAVEAVVNPYHRDSRLEFRPDHANEEELRTGSSFSKMPKHGRRGMREDTGTGSSGIASPSPPAPKRSLRRPSVEMMGFGAPSHGEPLASRGPMVLGSAAADDRCREMDGKASSNKILAAGRTGGFGSMDSSMRRYGTGTFSSRGDSVSSSMVPNTQDIDACFPPASPEACGRDRRSSGRRLEPTSPPPWSIPRRSGENGVRSRWCDKETDRSSTKKRPRESSTSPASVALRSQGSARAGGKSHDLQGKRRGRGNSKEESGVLLALLGCEEWEVKRTKVLCRALGQRRLYTQLVRGVTHVVIGSKHTMEDKGEVDDTKRRRHRLVNHGLEGYLEAVMMGLWVVDFSWVEACLEKIRDDATHCRNQLPQLAPVRSFEMLGCMKNHDGCDGRKSRKKRQANSSEGQCGASDREIFHDIVFHLVSGEERQSLRQEARLATLLELAGGSTSVGKKRTAVVELVVAVADDKDEAVSRSTAGAALERMADFPEATAAVNQSWILCAIENAEKPSFADHGVASRPTKRTMGQSPSSRHPSGDPLDAMLMEVGDDAQDRLVTEETSTRKEVTHGGSSGRLNVRSKRLRSNGVLREVVVEAENNRHGRGRGGHGISAGPTVTKSEAVKTRNVIEEASEIVRNYDRENKRRALRDPRASATARGGGKERTAKGIEFTRVADMKGGNEGVDTTRPDYWDENYAKNLEEGAGVKPNSNPTGGPSVSELYKVTVDLRKELLKAGYRREDEPWLADFWFALVYSGMVAPSAERYEQHVAAHREDLLKEYEQMQEDWQEELGTKAESWGCPLTILRRVFEKAPVALTEDADRRLRELEMGSLEVGDLEFSLWEAKESTGECAVQGASAEQKTGKGVDSAVEVS